MLKKHITGMQYVSIALLGFGVAFIHLSEHYATASSGGAEKEETTEVGVGDSDASQHQNQMLGLIAVLICCVTSSFSGKDKSIPF